MEAFVMTAVAAAACLSSLNNSIQLIDRPDSEASGYIPALIEALSSSACQTDSISDAPPLRQGALPGPLAAVIIADVFLPSISFPQSCQLIGRSVL